MKFYQVRKELSRDNGETLDTLFRSYSDKSYADNRAALMNRMYHESCTYYVTEVDHDYRTS